MQWNGIETCSGMEWGHAVEWNGDMQIVDMQRDGRDMQQNGMWTCSDMEWDMQWSGMECGHAVEWNGDMLPVGGSSSFVYPSSTKSSTFSPPVTQTTSVFSLEDEIIRSCNDQLHCCSLEETICLQ